MLNSPLDKYSSEYKKRENSLIQNIEAKDSSSQGKFFFKQLQPN